METQSPNDKNDQAAQFMLLAVAFVLMGLLNSFDAHYALRATLMLVTVTVMLGSALIGLRRVESTPGGKRTLVRILFGVMVVVWLTIAAGAAVVAYDALFAT